METRTFCRKCYENYIDIPGIKIIRKDREQRIKEPCEKCNRLGFDYLMEVKP